MFRALGLENSVPSVVIMGGLFPGLDVRRAGVSVLDDKLLHTMDRPGAKVREVQHLRSTCVLGHERISGIIVLMS